MYKRYGTLLFLECICAGLIGCGDMVVKLETNPGDSLCVESEHTLYLFDSDGQKIAKRYCNRCVEDDGDAGSRYCEECDSDECINDENYNGKLYKCKNNRWERDENGERLYTVCDGSCNGDKTACGECINTDIKCSQKAGYYKICADGKYGEDYECPTGVCANNKCAECRENICIGIDRVKYCTGTDWVKEENCPDGICVDGVCKTSCEEYGASRCIGDKIYTCEGSWTNPINCPEGEICIDSSKCGCKDGEVKNGNMYCSNGQWITLVSSQCEKGSTKCEYDKLYKCADGIWSEAAVCPHGCDKKGVKCYEIVEEVDDNDEELCSTEVNKCECTKNVCKEYSCVDNYWKAGDECKYGCDEKNLNCLIQNTEICKDGETECINEKEMHQCVKGYWGESKSCSYGCSKNSGVCKKCEEGDTKCENGQVSKCAEGVWAEYKNCSKSEVCDDAGKDCVSQTMVQCTEKATKCVDSKLMICKNGMWTQKATCSNCHPDGKICNECTPKAIQCINIDDQGVIKECSIYGVWDVIKKCSEVSCDAGGENCGKCLNGDSVCEACADSSIGKYCTKTCQDGSWKEELCSSGCFDNVCIESASMCEDGELKCDECSQKNQCVYICKSNKWSYYKSCSGKCANGKCL